MRLGFIVILIGSLYLLKNMHLIDSLTWSTLWPVILILIGISIVVRRVQGHNRWCDCRSCSRGGSSVCACGMGAYGKACGCDCAACATCEK